MAKGKLFKQIGIILGLSIILGFTVNFINPAGIPLVMDESKYSKDESNSDQLKDEYLKEQEQEKINLSEIKNNSNLLKKDDDKSNKDFVEPQRVKHDFAKILFDNSALFIDGRKAEEFNAEHIPNAVNIDYVEFSQKSDEEKKQIISKYNKDAVVVAYCGGGECDISIDLAYALADAGFTSVNIYLGGMLEWNEKGYPSSKN